MSILFVILLLWFAVPAEGGLRQDAAKVGVVYGGSVKTAYLTPAFKAAAGQHFGAIAAESETKMRHGAKGEFQFDFSRARTLANFANEINAEFVAHALLWCQAPPAGTWIFALEDDELADFGIRYIQEYFKAVPDTDRADIFNEYLNCWSIFHPLGESYLKRAYFAARQACPGCDLIFNEYNIEHAGGTQSAFLSLAQRLRASGVPINTIGLQSHLVSLPHEPQWRAFVQTLRAFGYQVMITELTGPPDVVTGYIQMARRAGIALIDSWTPALPFDVSGTVNSYYNAIAAGFGAPSGNGNVGGGVVGPGVGNPGNPSPPGQPSPPAGSFGGACLFAGWCGPGDTGSVFAPSPRPSPPAPSRPNPPVSTPAPTFNPFAPPQGASPFAGNW